MTRHTHPWGDLPGHDITGLADPFGTGDGHVPVTFSGVLIEGPRWAKPFAALAGLLAPLGRLVDKAVPGVVAFGLFLVGVAATGHAHLVGLSDTATGGYRPIHIVLIAIAVVVLALVTVDVIGFGARNKAVARTERARRAAQAAGHPWPSLAAPGTVLPDDLDLRDPNGLTGTGTPGTGTPGVGDLGPVSSPRDAA